MEQLKRGEMKTNKFVASILGGRLKISKGQENLLHLETPGGQTADAKCG